MMTEIPLGLDRWGLSGADASLVEHLGRTCLRFGEVLLTPTVAGLELADGTIEADLLVPPERSFHGLAWRVRGDDFESFFVRPHQVGNPDAIQYTPVSHGISSWQLYHGPGFWKPITFPIGRWFTIRVAFADDLADIFVDDLTTPVLTSRLRHAGNPGGIGLSIGGPGLLVSRFAVATDRPTITGSPEEPLEPDPAAIASWEVSDPFAEARLAGLTVLPASILAERSWTGVRAESRGLVDIARVHGIVDGRNTVLARTVIDAETAGTRWFELGFSDRAVVFLNSHAIFRGDDAYRTRDYRFLGSIGWWDAVALPLRAGRNELVVAVSEDFGGWGIMARVR